MAKKYRGLFKRDDDCNANVTCAEIVCTRAEESGDDSAWGAYCACDTGYSGPCRDRQSARRFGSGSHLAARTEIHQYRDGWTAETIASRHVCLVSRAGTTER